MLDNKFHNMLQDYMNNLKKNSKKELTKKELNEKIQEFINKYNADELEYENTPLDEANELLEQARLAKNRKEAIKLAKKASEICPYCLDAILFQAELEKNALIRDELLKKGLESEKKRLTKEGFFDKENIGYFYGIFETRPYIRGLYTKVDFLIWDGKITLAKDLCLEILKLNKNDNLGARYMLMAIYAYFEEEKEMLKLYKKYPEENLSMLFPLFALYYKKENYIKAKEYLIKINKCNSNFIKYFKGTIKKDKDAIPGYYSMGSSSEIYMYFSSYYFIFGTMSSLKDFILEHSKKLNNIK